VGRAIQPDTPYRQVLSLVHKYISHEMKTQKTKRAIIQSRAEIEIY